MPALERNDGGMLEYAESGHGRPLVFLHGWSLSGQTFDAQHAALKAPGLLPAKVGEKYNPPDQSAALKY